MAETYQPESSNEDDLCTHCRLGRHHADDRWCVHLKDHDGDHHWEGEPVA